MIHSNDLAIASKGLEFDSSRSWNSLANEAPGYGYGWVDSNAVYVQVATSGNVAYTEGAGNTFPFIKEGSNFRDPDGDRSDHVRRLKVPRRAPRAYRQARPTS